MDLAPLELVLTTEDGMTASELDKRCWDTFHGQKALDDFFRGDISEDELVAKLEYYDIEWQPLIDVLELNLVMKYGIKTTI